MGKVEDVNCQWRLKMSRKEKKINGGRRASIREIGEGVSLVKRSLSGENNSWLTGLPR